MSKDQTNYPETIFVQSSIKEISGDGYSFYSVDIKKDDFDSLPVNSSGYVKLTMNRRKEPSRYGETHFLTLNQYKGRKQENHD